MRSWRPRRGVESGKRGIALANFCAATRDALPRALSSIRYVGDYRTQQGAGHEGGACPAGVAARVRHGRYVLAACRSCVCDHQGAHLDARQRRRQLPIAILSASAVATPHGSARFEEAKSTSLLETAVDLARKIPAQDASRGRAGDSRGLGCSGERPRIARSKAALKGCVRGVQGSGPYASTAREVAEQLWRSRISARVGLRRRGGARWAPPIGFATELGRGRDSVRDLEFCWGEIGVKCWKETSK